MIVLDLGIVGTNHDPVYRKIELGTPTGGLRKVATRPHRLSPEAQTSPCEIGGIAHV